MSFSIVVDMNLSPGWVPFLQYHGHAATHWSTIGDPKALDPHIMDWARNNDHLVLTHDLDFGTILAQTHATGPSVVLIRADETFPSSIGSAVVGALLQCEAELRAGALVVIDVARRRVRVLPI